MTATLTPQSDPALVGDREILIVRTFSAPRELVFQALTEPGHAAQWWGPRGFSLTTRSMDVRPGGAWRFTMHGPDGQDYENLITYLEVVRPVRLVYKHGGDKDVEPVNFQVTMTLDEIAGKTRLTSRMVFPSAQAREHVIKTYGALEGAKQNFDRLEQHLSALSAAAADRPFVLTRVFKAPVEVVFKAWTQEEALKQWFGPRGCPVFYAKNDLRAGGELHYGMHCGPQDMWGKWTYREITPPTRLVFVVSFSDPEGGMSRHPFQPDWPRETLSTVTFEPHAGKGGGTVVTIEWTPLNATEAERSTFNANHAGMGQGWAGTMEQLDAYLARA